MVCRWVKSWYLGRPPCWKGIWICELIRTNKCYKAICDKWFVWSVEPYAGSPCSQVGRSAGYRPYGEPICWSTLQTIHPHELGPKLYNKDSSGPTWIFAAFYEPSKGILVHRVSIIWTFVFLADFTIVFEREHQCWLWFFPDYYWITTSQGVCIYIYISMSMRMYTYKHAYRIDISIQKT